MKEPEARILLDRYNAMPSIARSSIFLASPGAPLDPMAKARGLRGAYRSPQENQAMLEI
ncbi:MAG: hypothetical protein N2690_13235 [Rhodocyclaceae bacterium]|nr:hypothetical protein [Rhodocyclaceae bacterium]